MALVILGCTINCRFRFADCPLKQCCLSSRTKLLCLNQDTGSLLVKRQNDNPSPDSSHKGSKPCVLFVLFLLFVILVISCWFLGLNCVLIASVPDLCILFTLRHAIIRQVRRRNQGSNSKIIIWKAQRVPQ